MNLLCEISSLPEFEKESTDHETENESGEEEIYPIIEDMVGSFELFGAGLVELVQGCLIECAVLGCFWMSWVIV